MVQILPEVAQRRANGYLGVHVAMALRAHNPRLLVGQRPIWRFDIGLLLPGLSQITTLGEIDVDAVTGEVAALEPSQITELIEHCDGLASRFPPPAAGAS
jgi:hypothetical protein